MQANSGGQAAPCQEPFSSGELCTGGDKQLKLVTVRAPTQFIEVAQLGVQLIDGRPKQHIYRREAKTEEVADLPGGLVYLFAHAFNDAVDDSVVVFIVA
jgi:hypothetical protein